MSPLLLVTFRQQISTDTVKKKWVVAYPSSLRLLGENTSSRLSIVVSLQYICNLFAFSKVGNAFIPPFKLVIIKVRDLPDKDKSLRKGDDTDPYVRIRFTDLETGKV